MSTPPQLVASMYDAHRRMSMRECVTSELITLKPNITLLLLRALPDAIKQVESTPERAVSLWSSIVCEALVVSCDGRLSSDEDHGSLPARLRLDIVKTNEAVRALQPYNLTHRLPTELPEEIATICNRAIADFCARSGTGRPPIEFSVTPDGGINVSIMSTSNIHSIVAFLTRVCGGASTSAVSASPGMFLHDSSSRTPPRGGGARF